jgi:hypothetical protein
MALPKPNRINPRKKNVYDITRSRISVLSAVAALDVLKQKRRKKTNLYGNLPEKQKNCGCCFSEPTQDRGYFYREIQEAAQQ